MARGRAASSTRPRGRSARSRRPAGSCSPSRTEWTPASDCPSTFEAAYDREEPQLMLARRR
eukprot:4484627-Alexandrium_andersonii.AAC.1